MQVCNITFRHKKQLRSGVHIKIEPGEEFTASPDSPVPIEAIPEGMLRNDLYTDDLKDNVKMDEWLRAVPDPITEEYLPAFGTRESGHYCEDCSRYMYKTIS